MKDGIVLNNIGLIYKAIKDLNCQYRTEDDFEDYYFAGLVGLINASKVYEPVKSNSSFLYICIVNEIKKVFITRNAKKRKGRTLSLNQTINNMEYIDIIPSKMNYEEKIILREWINSSINRLRNKKDADIIRKRFLKGMKTKEIAKENHTSRQMVEKRLRNGLKALKMILERDL